MTTKPAAEIIPLRDTPRYQEPCVAVEKLRVFGENEQWDRWCYVHHHWLNGAPAKKVSDHL